MPAIKRLSEEIIGKIAAGEVVERPASAVKELVENSIDAGAKNITVELKEGGISYIRVSDNGCGIPESDARMAFERNATSKLRTADELYGIRSLGFRGEALASIAAVAKVTLTTRTKDAAFGTRAIVEGGRFVEVREAASPVGTSIVVENLFFNTPVRLKFLKKPAMEAALVSDYMLRLILSRPDIAIRFVNQGKTIYRSVGDGRIESALLCLYGRETLGGMHRVSGHMNGVVADGFIGAGELARGNRQQQSFFINGRYFKSAALAKALEAGCEGRLMVGRFPMCAIYLQMPYELVDVNVHPNKLEVRFQNEAAVAQAIETLAREALSGQSLGSALRSGHGNVVNSDKTEKKSLTAEITQIGTADDETSNVQTAETKAAASMPTAEKPAVVVRDEPIKQPAAVCKLVEKPKPSTEKVSKDKETAAETLEDEASIAEAIAKLKPISIPAVKSASSLHETSVPASRAEALLRRYAEAKSEPQKPDTAVPKPDKAAEPAQIVIPEAEKPAEPRFVGIVFDTYIIFEAGDRLLLVDQHAAHERMLYDRMLESYNIGEASQRLLAPLLVHLTAREMALAVEMRQQLSDAGFEIEPFDESSVAIHAIPTIFGDNGEPRSLFIEAIDELQSGRGEATKERVRRKVAQMACKRAIKGGDKLSEAELNGFVAEMLKSEVMPTCPHGRPIVTEITRYALEKRFKRVQ